MHLDLLSIPRLASSLMSIMVTSTGITITTTNTSCQTGSYFEVNGSGLVLPSILLINMNNASSPIGVLLGLPISGTVFFIFLPNTLFSL